MKYHKFFFWLYFIDSIPLKIGHDVWIREGAIILPGVNFIGNVSVVGTESVLTIEVPGFSIFAGNAARKIGERFSEEIVSLIEKLQWRLLTKDKLIKDMDVYESRISRQHE